jgi:hypothetical protein
VKTPEDSDVELLECRLTPSNINLYAGANIEAVAATAHPGDYLNLHTGHYAGFCVDESGLFGKDILIEGVQPGVFIDGQAMFEGSNWLLSNCTVPSVSVLGSNIELASCKIAGDVTVSGCSMFEALGDTIGGTLQLTNDYAVAIHVNTIAAIDAVHCSGGQISSNHCESINESNCSGLYIGGNT